ncbi:MAG: Flp pilus assembly protein CpaB [Myxococcales bacterium]|jgi:Flp pilus assembly protein CpaB
MIRLSTCGRTALSLALLLASLACGEAGPESRHVVLVAAGPLEAGTALESQMLTRLALPERELRPGMVRASELVAVRGQRLAVALAAGDPLPRSALVPAGMPLELGETLEAGRRAMTLPVFAADEVCRGDRVDVLASLSASSASEPTMVTLLSNVLVLAVEDARPHPLREEGSGARAVTFAVEPADAELLALALGEGTVAFYVTLRNAEDSATAEDSTRSTASSLMTERSSGLCRRCATGRSRSSAAATRRPSAPGASTDSASRGLAVALAS